jgi:hypothetical protein
VHQEEGHKEQARKGAGERMQTRLALGIRQSLPAFHLTSSTKPSCCDSQRK